jgi:hypothetical protein
VHRAVDRAVDRDVKAATAPLAANIRNLNIRLRNGRLNNAPTMPALPLTPPVKEVEGHPGRTPNDLRHFRMLLLGPDCRWVWHFPRVIRTQR